MIGFNMKKNVAIEFKNVSKKYGDKYSRGKKNCVIDNLSLEIFRGQKVGLIGKNGTGKTTFLKLISGICTPNNGEIKTKGRIAALLNLEDGFDLNLSGKENIYLNGLLVGMTRSEVNKKMDSIIDFSGIRNFIDAPFYTYSSGMKFRLAFAVAISSESEILIMDEIFLAGDFDYQSKILKEIKHLNKKRKEITVLISSHDPIFLLSLINCCYQFKNGKLISVDMKDLIQIAKKRDNKFQKLLF